ncbi:TNF receptor-associated factor 2-like [Ptychodera flava]|uniref:TNF receptor-associated factor 2-like n=1 Tax=Ptychodera flava TaxID=63121 RepID=UPI003969D6B6
MPGYNTAILDEADRDEKFLCTSCRLILKDPLQSFCGHRFCRSCVHGLSRLLGRYECPTCSRDDSTEGSVFDIDKLFPDRAIYREMKDLRTRCTNRGCEWQGIFRQYEAHLESCWQVEVDCTYCGNKVIREKMQEHTDLLNGDCPNKMQPCKFYDIGCKTPIEKGQEAEHSALAVQDHMRLLLQGVNRLKQFRETLEENGQEYRRLTVTIEDHCGILHNLQIDINRLENDLKNLPSLARSEVTGGIQSLTQMMEKLGKTTNEMEKKNGALETKVSTYEGIIAVLNGEVERNADMVQKMKREEKKLQDTLSAVEKKTKAQDRIIALKDVTLAEQDLRIQSLEMASYDGILTWKISEFGRKRRDAISGRTLSLYSPYFFSSQFGYKMCARIYLNGDGMGKGNHVSLFFVVMKGENDAILRWPFQQKVTFMWIDQSNREHMIDAFRPDPNSSSFKRPTGDMNIASGCPLFMPLTMLDDGKHAYVKDDTAFLRITIDTSDI